MNTPETSAARLAANRENAAHSTGPKTAAGKANSSMNAVTTALTGRTVLLPTDNLAEYETHLAAYTKKFEPLTAIENSMVQSIADLDWRLNRIPHLILAIYTKGQEDFAEAFTHLPDAARALRIELETYLKYEKQIRNLQLQENRLHRRRERDIGELRYTQRERDIQRGKDLGVAATLFLAAQHDNEPFDPADHGFDFSTDDVRSYLKGSRAANIAREYKFGAQSSA